MAYPVITVNIGPKEYTVEKLNLDRFLRAEERFRSVAAAAPQVQAEFKLWRDGFGIANREDITFAQYQAVPAKSEEAQVIVSKLVAAGKTLKELKEAGAFSFAATPTVRDIVLFLYPRVGSALPQLLEM